MTMISGLLEWKERIDLFKTISSYPVTALQYSKMGNRK